jgi:RNA polymerase sigma-70 factor, ECF subfamily
MTDRIIIQRVLDGDVEAFSGLVDRHYARCARIAVRIVGNREDAEEAIQDAFLRAFKALGDYEDRERFSAWLTRILVNQCRTVLARPRDATLEPVRHSAPPATSHEAARMRAGFAS